MQNPWEILGVPQGADLAAVKKAYKTLALKYHPDRNPGDKAAEEKFKEITSAYETITSGKATEPRPGPGFANVDDFIGSIFSQFGGGFAGGGFAHEQHHPQFGVQINPVYLSFEEYCLGVEKQVDIILHEECGTCLGVGAKAGDYDKCQVCRGTGKATVRTGMVVLQMGDCQFCNGMGKKINIACADCSGSGETVKNTVGSIRIPGTSGGRIVVNVRGVNAQVKIVCNKPEHDMQLQGVDVKTQHTLDLADALAGTDIQVQTVRGVKNVKVPPLEVGAISLRLSGLGARHGQQDGDHIVDIKVKFPVGQARDVALFAIKNCK